MKIILKIILNHNNIMNFINYSKYLINKKITFKIKINTIKNTKIINNSIFMKYLFPKIITSKYISISDGWTPLNIACNFGHVEIVKILIEKNIDINIPNNDGWTPLNTACIQGHKEIVKILIEKDIDIDIPNNDGWTPLNTACFFGHTEIIKMLTEKDNCINSLDIKYDTKYDIK